VDWEAEGLLEDLPDEGAREARRALLEELHQDGVPVETLREAVAEQRLALLPLDRLLGGEAKYTAREVAEESGLPLDRLLAIRRALGLAVPDADDRVLSDDDLESAKLGVRVREAGFDDDHVLEANRVLGRWMARFAEALGALGAEVVLEAGADELELARRFAAVAEEQLPLAREWLQHVFVMHFRQMLRHEAVTLQERTTGRIDHRSQAIAFADLVGFTELGETVAVEELGTVAARLQRLAGEVVEPPVRLVKTIGDAAMLVSEDNEALVQTALELVARADDAREGFPQLRAGVACGPALNRGGDWYGRPVNVASRVTSVARPGSVLVTSGVKDAIDLDGKFGCSFAGKRKLKGVKGEVPLFRIRSAGSSSG